MKPLKIALIGYGRMGRMIHNIALGRGHSIAITIDSPTDEGWDSPELRNADVAIEFTMPEVAASNVRRLLDLGLPVISGTTGWAKELQAIRQELDEGTGQGALLWASNFSIGVNLFFAISREMGRIMEHIPSYQAEISETHHIHKLDAPSGTAITLAEGIVATSPSRFEDWHLCDGSEHKPTSLGITAIREGEVPGIHTLSYRSSVDSIELKHEAKGREGFAEGAVVAAEFIATRRGFFTMEHLMQALLGSALA